MNTNLYSIVYYGGKFVEGAYVTDYSRTSSEGYVGSLEDICAEVASLKDGEEGIFGIITPTGFKKFERDDWVEDNSRDFDSRATMIGCYHANLGVRHE